MIVITRGGASFSPFLRLSLSRSRREHPPLRLTRISHLAVLKTASKREGVCTPRYRISIPMLDCLYARHPQLAG